MSSTVALLGATSGLTTALLARRRRKRDFRLFILAYHEVSDGLECEGTIARNRLVRQLQGVRRKYRFASLSEALELLVSPKGLEEDLVAITFDDGTQGNYTNGLPVFKEIEANATVFVTTSFIDGEPLWFDYARRAIRCLYRDQSRTAIKTKQDLASLVGTSTVSEDGDLEVQRMKYFEPGRRAEILRVLESQTPEVDSSLKPLRWEQVRELRASGFEIGCHTVTHPILSTLTPDLQLGEIEGSRDRIAEELGEPPTSFAYPNGSLRDFTDRTADLVKEAGFRSACTTVRGSNKPGCNRYRLRRLGVGSDSAFLLEARLVGLFDDELRKWIP